MHSGLCSHHHNLNLEHILLPIKLCPKPVTPHAFLYSNILSCRYITFSLTTYQCGIYYAMLHYSYA